VRPQLALAELEVSLAEASPVAAPKLPQPHNPTLTNMTASEHHDGAYQMTSNGRLPLSSRLGFAIGDIGFNIVWQGTSLFLMYVYTDVFGISPTVAGAVYMAALVWDAIFDPIVGVIADRTRTRWGRFRPWIAIGAIPMALSYALAFWNPGFNGVALIAWVAFTHGFLRTAFAMANIPFSSLQARLSGDSKERTELAGMRMIGAGIGGLSVALITPALVHRMSSDEGQGYLLAAISGGVLTFAAMLYVVFVMREPEESRAVSDEPLWGDVGAFFMQLVRNVPLAQIFAVLIVVSMAMTMFSKNILYYFKYVLHAPPGSESIALVMTPVALIFFAPVWVMLANRLSKRNTWMIASALASTGYLSLYLIPVREVGVTYACVAFVALGVSGFGVLAWSMLPDTVEWGEVKLGVRHEAKVFGFSAFAQKSALGINALILGVTLDAIGYVPNQPQTPEALHGITSLMTLVPLAGVIISVLVLWTYPIDAKRHAELQAELAERRRPVESVS
jgi:GPH family glycoside/pentoside/hexuronide:cation symporter